MPGTKSSKGMSGLRANTALSPGKVGLKGSGKLPKEAGTELGLCSHLPKLNFQSRRKKTGIISNQISKACTGTICVVIAFWLILRK